MEKYLGVKLIEAEPQTTWGVQSEKYPATDGDEWLQDNENKDGYKVVYEDGYTSWSPKDVFEKAYREIKNGIPLDKGNWLPHQGRVVQEARELRENSDKLFMFIDTNNIFKSLDINEQIRLNQQLMTMQYYLTILIERIENF